MLAAEGFSAIATASASIAFSLGVSDYVSGANLYREAGAECLFVPWIKDAKSTAAPVHEIERPLTVVMGVTGALLSVADLQALGVRRIRIGASLARATFGLIGQAACEMRAQGTWTFAQQWIPADPVCKFFASSDRAWRFM